MTVLVLTCEEDVTADTVIHQLAQRDVPTVRVDPQDYPERLEVVTTSGPDGMHTVLDTGRRQLDLADVRSVWVRRPGPPGGRPPEQAAWVALECERHLWGALRTIPPDRWMNHPDAGERHRYKVWQLHQAHAAGFDVPPTWIGNAPKSATQFVGSHAEVVMKSVSGRHPDDPPVTIPTTPLPPEADLAAVAVSPPCLQERVAKAADIRLTVIGDDMFACRITAPGVLDWRWEDPASCQWTTVPVPAPLRETVRAYMGASNLVYGAFDFAEETTTGRLLFLECNAGGQFVFVERLAGQPIAAAIAAWLAGDR